jgi:hypothetical protein
MPSRFPKDLIRSNRFVVGPPTIPDTRHRFGRRSKLGMPSGI